MQGGRTIVLLLLLVRLWLLVLLFLGRVLRRCLHGSSENEQALLALKGTTWL